jgi:hypothetical protein
MEKFIETIFPSQPQSAQASRELQEQAQQRSKEDRWEVFLVALSVLAAVLVCGAAMVRRTPTTLKF